MRYSGTDRDDDSTGWFRLGSVEMTTTNIVLALWVITLFVWAAEPVDKPITSAMAMIPDDVAKGEVWRLFTWPWSHEGFGLFDIIGAAIFWIFGTQLEAQVGRKRFTWLIGSSILIISTVATALGLLLSSETVLSDLDLLQLVVLLLYIAEYPTRPFFFNIPAWVIGAVIVALEVINDLAFRDWVRLLTVFVAAALIALVARKIDLLSNYDRVPDVRMPRRKRRGETSAPNRGRPTGRSGRGSGAGAPEPKRSGSLWGRKAEAEPAEIVQMPTRPRPRPPVETTVPDNFSVDDLALDALLDKISEGGMDALTDAERQSLDELRARRRGRPTS
ncbi:MAG: rhomboid family intramembrane serine protease [Solirubrobacteraceae bacterium]|nr:rhomboid family intramembrane serine protease [Solirubrobacteraceae bacterium]